MGGAFEAHVLTILPGEGGDDSASFAKDLAKAYVKWGERRGVKVRVTSESAKRIEMELSGMGVLDHF